MKDLFSFPNPVNEVSARLVAGGVVILTLATIVFQQPVLLVLLAYGFVARVLTGPTLSPLGQFVTRVLTPALPFEPKYVAGPPKRFAQGIGATLSVLAVILYFGFGLDHRRVRNGRADHDRRDPRVGVRDLPRMQGVRGPDAHGCDLRRGVRALQQHLGQAHGDDLNCVTTGGPTG